MSGDNYAPRSPVLPWAASNPTQLQPQPPPAGTLRPPQGHDSNQAGPRPGYKSVSPPFTYGTVPYNQTPAGPHHHFQHEQQHLNQPIKSEYQHGYAGPPHHQDQPHHFQIPGPHPNSAQLPYEYPTQPPPQPYQPLPYGQPFAQQQPYHTGQPYPQQAYPQAPAPGSPSQRLLEIKSEPQRDVDMPPRRAAVPAPVVEPSPVRTKFPTARIKRIMQADEEVGKVAQQTPIAVGKALEMFMIQMVTKSAEVAKDKGSKRVNAQMLKQVVETDEQWDFLRDIVGRVENEREGGKSKAKVESESEEEIPEPKKKGRGGRRKKSDV